MRLGARWEAGDAPHRGVPGALHGAIEDAEREQPTGAAWTLTWLEGRPRVELRDEADHVLADLRIDPSGKVVRTGPAGRAASGARAADNGAAADSRAGAGSTDGDPDEDDDDWLT